MLTPEQLAEIRRRDESVDPDDMIMGDIDRRRLLAEVRQLTEDRDRARAALENMTNSRDMWRSDAEDADADVARIRGYAEQLAKSDGPAHADHGRALLSVLDGGER